MGTLEGDMTENIGNERQSLMVICSDCNSMFQAFDGSVGHRDQCCTSCFFKRAGKELDQERIRMTMVELN